MIRACRLTLLASLMLSGIATAPAMAELPRLLPVPAQMREGQGIFLITSTTPIRVPANDAAARNAAERFADLVARSRGFRPRIEAGSDGRNAISFRRAKTGAAESYTLDVTDKGATITAGDDAGLLYGAVTLWQAMTQDQAAGPVSVAAMRIADAPRFQWRGLMLDSARHFQSPAYVRQLIDWMAVNKLNRLHWHLVDDQGWRIEIPKYPRLTEISAWRVPAGAPGAPPLPKVGGFYTQAEIREIVAYAAARGIMIVPEIEMPGHALAAIRAYPALGMGAPIPPGTESDWGVFPWLYNADDATFTFLEDVLTDVMALFPAPYIHIGGDEAVKDQWKSSRVMQAKMKALGIGSEDAMQGWFMHRIDDFLTRHGRKPIGWDEILEGGASPHATITSWRGIEGAVTAAKSGHDAILSPAPILYFDNRQGFGPLEPPGRGHLSDLHSVYDFNPEPEGLSAAEQHHILGLQGNLFTEHVRTEERAQWQQFPRGSAVAEIGWSPVASHDFAGFMDRLVPQMARMGTLGLKPAISALTVTAKTDYAPGDKVARVTLASQSGFPIHYTLDGSTVTPRAPLYKDGLSLPVGTRLRAGTAWRGGMMPGAIDIGLDASFLRRRTDEQLGSCANKVVLSLEDDAPAQGERAHFLTDILQPCWLYADAPVGGASKIAIDVGQLPFNFQIGKDREAIRFRAPATPAGEMEVRAGGCEGERIAVLPLAPAVNNPEVTRLVAPIAPRSGKANLCITYTAKDVEPLWAIKQVELIP